MTLTKWSTRALSEARREREARGLADALRDDAGHSRGRRRVRQASLEPVEAQRPGRAALQHPPHLTQGRYSNYQTNRRNNLMFDVQNTERFLRKAKTEWRSSALKDPKARVGKDSAEDAAATR